MYILCISHGTTLGLPVLDCQKGLIRFLGLSLALLDLPYVKANSYLLQQSLQSIGLQITGIPIYY
jgi:hypothetical protein